MEEEKIKSKQLCLSLGIFCIITDDNKHEQGKNVMRNLSVKELIKGKIFQKTKIKLEYRK